MLSSYERLHTNTRLALVIVAGAGFTGLALVAGVVAAVQIRAWPFGLGVLRQDIIFVVTNTGFGAIFVAVRASPFPRR